MFCDTLHKGLAYIVRMLFKVPQTVRGYGEWEHVNCIFQLVFTDIEACRYFYLESRKLELALVLTAGPESA